MLVGGVEPIISLLIAINPFIGNNSSGLSNVIWTKKNEPCLCVGHACTSIYVKEERNKEKSEVVGGYSLWVTWVGHAVQWDAGVVHYAPEQASTHACLVLPVKIRTH